MTFPPRRRGNPNLVYHDSRHPNARFSDATVRRIRRRASDGVSLVEMAEALDCHYDTLRRIVNRESYSGVHDMADLPRPDVEVTSREIDTGGYEVDLVISREGKAKSYTGGEGRLASRDGAFKESVEKMLGDPYTAEWIPRKAP